MFQVLEIDGTPTSGWGLNSAGECYLHTVEVTGSIPVAPTIFPIKILKRYPRSVAFGRRFSPRNHDRLAALENLLEILRLAPEFSVRRRGEKEIEQLDRFIPSVSVTQR